MFYCILAGGKSRRMGQDKAFLQFKDGYLIEDMIRRFQQTGGRVCISSADGNLSKRLNHRVQPSKEVADVYKDIGPLGGIYSLLHELKEDIFVIAVDMPLVDIKLVESMIKASDGKSAVLMRNNGRLEPLFAYYSKSCEQAALEQIKAGDYRITEFIKRAGINCVLEDDLKEIYGKGFEWAIFNMNTPSDYEKVLDFIA